MRPWNCSLLLIAICSQFVTAATVTNRPTTLHDVFEQQSPGGTFVWRGTGVRVEFAAAGRIRFEIRQSGNEMKTVSLTFRGASHSALPVGDPGTKSGVARYYLSHWQAPFERPMYTRIRYRDLYPGVDVIFFSDGGVLEYDLALAAHADPSRIRIEHSELPLRINPQGDLEAGSPAVLTQMRPLVYQVRGSGRVAVSCRYILHDDGAAGFRVGGYDPGAPLTIDPVLNFATDIGSEGNEAAYAMVTDSAGAVYIAGETDSAAFAGTGRRSSSDVFVGKLRASGVGFDYVLFLGGNGRDAAKGIAVDSSGNAYITGTSNSSDFPVTRGAPNSGFEDVFVAKIDSTGSVIYAVTLGSTGSEEGDGIAVDASGNAYVTGQTTSLAFPTTTGAFQKTYGGGISDCFVFKLNAAGTATLYSTYLGGAGLDLCRGVAIDSTGNAYVTGTTYSTNFPVQAAFQSALSGTADAFVTKLAASGSTLVYSTFLGGSSNEDGNAIAVDSSGAAYVAGHTLSTNFPVTAGSAQSIKSGDYDAFVAKLFPAGNALVYSTFAGGSGGDSATSIAVDPLGRVLIAGFTNSPNLPLNGAIQTSWRGSFDTFAAVLNGSGYQWLFSTYLGGAGDDRAYAAAIGTSNRIYIAGVTQSVDFTGVSNRQTSFGNSDIIVAQITGDWQDAPVTMSVTPGSATLYANQSQQFTATVAAPSQLVTWSISPSVGTINSAGLYTAPSSISTSQTVTVTASSQIYPGSSATAGVTLTAPAVQFVKFDSSTQGTWKGVYGGSGYNIVNNAVNYPAYVTPVANGAAAFTWNGSTTDVRALQQASSAQRIAGVWYADSFTIDLPFTDSQMHQVALYCLDWDKVGRTQTLQVLNATNSVVDTRTVSNFGGGVWAVWNLSGHVQIRVTRTGPVNAVVSGIFFDTVVLPGIQVSISPQSATLSGGQTSQFTATVTNTGNTAVTWSLTPNVGSISSTGLYTAPATVAAAQTVTVTARSVASSSATASATITLTPPAGVSSASFLKFDTSTQGSWKGVYGSDGYNIINHAVSYPAYVTPTVTGNASYTWNASTTDVRALQQTASTQRFAGVWYTSDRIVVDLPFNNQTHLLAVYCLDWDKVGRGQTLEILDGSGNVLDTRSLSNFGGGVWLVWNVSGSVKLRITRTAGLNAVVSGIFFAPGGTVASGSPVSFVQLDTATQGSWKGKYGTEGYNVVGDVTAYPSYVSPVASGNASYTWSASTTDVRALQQSASTTQRIAGVWYAATQFTIDLPFSGSASHQLAVYCLDWDNVGRTQTLEILDANDMVLDSRNVSNFRTGVWAVWTVSGHMKLRITRTGPANAVLSGIFFGPAPN